MTIAAFAGQREDKGIVALFDGFETHTVADDGRVVCLGREGDGTDAFLDSEVVVVTESPGGRPAAAVADAYRREGPSFVSRIEGPFDCVLYDARKQLLLAASDLTSRKQLSYWCESNTVVISSKLLRLLRYSKVGRELDDLYAAHLVTGYWAAPPGTTVMKGIKRLPAGVALTSASGKISLLELDRCSPRRLPARSFEAWVEAFWGEVDGAVGRVMQSDARTCLSLGGGIDSAAVASAMATRALGPAPMAAFSIVAPDRGIDESLAIEAIEHMYSARIAGQRIDCGDAVNVTALDAFELQDDPVLTPLAFLPARLRLWAAARTAGFHTVLDGEGGDELFALSFGPREALLQGRWLKAWRHLLGRQARRALFARAFALPMLPPGVRREWARRKATYGQRLPSYLTEGARRHPAFEQAGEQFYENQIEEDFASTVRRWLSSPQSVGARTTHLSLASKFGLTLVSPLLERRVVELVLGIPAEWMLSTGYKAFLPDASKGRVPDLVRLQAKDARLASVLWRDIVTSRGVRDLFQDPRVRDRLGAWIRFERVNGLLDAIARGYDPDNSIFWQQIEGLVSLAYWYRRASALHGVG